MLRDEKKEDDDWKNQQCVELKGQSTGLARKQQFTVEINNLKNISVIKIWEKRHAVQTCE